VDADALADAYLLGLQAADVDAVVGLFAPNGMVHSPLYGILPAGDFYAKLFADTDDAQLTMRGVLRGNTPAGTPLIAIWFHFDWILRSGEPAPFDVVDVLKLDDAGKIATLHIVYDTTGVRPAFTRSTNAPRHAGDIPAST
jgi:SnoaL-like protein